MKRIGFLGYGKIGKALHQEIIDSNFGEVSFIQRNTLEDFGYTNIKVTNRSDLSLYNNANFFIECATADALKENIDLILTNGDLLLFSVTAFADPEFEKCVNELGEKYQHNVYIPHGAILGLDGIMDGKEQWKTVTIETIKSPASLGKSLSDRKTLFEGCTREACSIFPRNVNVHAAIALAGIGFDRTFSKIIADPAVTTNSHRISLEGDGIQMKIEVSSYTEGGVSGIYTPLSARGSLQRILDVERIIQVV